MAHATPLNPVGHLCVVGSTHGDAQQIAQILTQQRYAVAHAPDIDALDARLGVPPDLVLIDARAQPAQATAMLTALQTSPTLADTGALLLLAEVPAPALLDGIADADAAYLVRPADDAEIVAAVTLQLRRRERDQRARREHGRLEQAHAAQQRALADQQALVTRYRSVFERLPLGTMIVSATNRIEQVNPALCRFVGYTEQELIGRQPGFLTAPDDHASTIAHGHQLAAGQIDQFVLDRRRYLRKDGTSILGRLTTAALRHDAGYPQAYLAFVEDIGGRALIEDHLARYTNYQQALADASLHLLTVAPDTATRATVLKQALQHLVDGAATGRAYLFRNRQHPRGGLAIELVAEAWSAGLRSLRESKNADRHRPFPYTILPEAHRQRLLAPMPAGGLVDEIYADAPELLAMVQADGIRSTQTVPVIVDGVHWGFAGFDDHARARVWDHIDLVMLTTSATMLGQTLHRWQVEDELRATSRLLQTTERVARLGGWSLDLTSRALSISAQLAALLEVAPSAVGDSAALLAFCAPGARPQLQAALEAAAADGGPWDLELPFVTATGRQLWIASQGQAERQDGHAVRLVGTAQDVTQRKRAELQLEQQLRIETGLTRCSQALLTPVGSLDDLRQIASAALEHLRDALGVDQAFLMRLIPDSDAPYLTLLAFASVAIPESPYEHPLGQRLPLSLVPRSRLRAYEAGESVIGVPRPEEMETPAQRAWLEHDRAQTRIALPLHIDGALWGIVGFNGLTPRAWDEHEQLVLRTATEMLGHVVRRWQTGEALRRSEEQFRAAVETMLDGLAILESMRDDAGAIQDFRFRYINEVGSRLNERPREAHLGHALLDLLPTRQYRDLIADYVRVVETGSPLARELVVYDEADSAGSRLAHVFDVRAARLGDGLAVVWRDVTDRHLAHESLAQANEDALRRINELRALNLIAQTLAFAQDLPVSLRTVCDTVAARTEASRVIVASFAPDDQPPARHARADEAPAEGMIVLASADLGDVAPSLVTLRRPLALHATDQTAVLARDALRRLGLADATHLLLVPLTSAASNVGLLALGRGADSRPFSADDQSLVETIAGQIATAISNARLAEQAQQAARLAERSRVARDLHDSATQALYSLSLLAGGWAMAAEQGHLTDVPARFTQLGGIALQVLRELRLLIYELRHPELAENGLIEALQQRLAAVEHRTSVQTALIVSGELAPLSPEVEEHLYAVMREALNNALRHAQARSVTVSISVEREQQVFAVRDDGAGFDPAAPSSGLGLHTMRERAAAIGARLTLASTPGAGTLVEVCLPASVHRGDTHD